MRTVLGPTGRVVVVGAGLGGLSAALRLAGAGRDVCVVEKLPVPGGRAGVWQAGDHTFDTGPTVLTMPDLIADALACVDEHLEDWLDLVPLDPAYRAFFPDGSQLDVIADVDRMAAQVADVCGAQDAAGYRRFARWAQRLFEVERRDFIDRNLDSPLDLLTPSLARLAALGGFRRMAPKVGGFFHDHRLRRLFSFQALYAGLSPYDALAMYASIAYLDAVAGVCFPRGGMHAVPQALANAAAKHGVEFRYDTAVTSLERRGDRFTAVMTEHGERLAADTVILNVDLPEAWRLLGRPRRRLRWSPSCVLLLAGVRGHYEKIAHHNLHFGASWQRSLRELTSGRLMHDPSLLVTAPTVTDPTLAPAGHTTMSALCLVPNLDDGAELDWASITPRVRDDLVRRLEREGYVGLGDAIEVEEVVTPRQWAEQGLAAGTPFSASHKFAQTGPFRPGNVVADNVVLAGCGTTPGIGVPMVLLSGRLAAERVVGAGVR